MIWLLWVFIAEHGLSLVVPSEGCSLIVVHWLLTVAVSLVEHGLQGTRASAVWHTALVAHDVESSRTRGRTCVACIGRWILNHWTPGESGERL